MSAILARLFVSFQWLLPRHIITSIVCSLARIRNVSVKNFLIKLFINAYDVNTEELDRPVPDGFESFNAFFTRGLAKGARPVDTARGTIVSPADGTVSIE